jgi:hypothetical protein
MGCLENKSWFGGSFRGEVRSVGEVKEIGFHTQFLGFDGQDLDWDSWVTKNREFWLKDGKVKMETTKKKKKRWRH